MSMASPSPFIASSAKAWKGGFVLSCGAPLLGAVGAADGFRLAGLGRFVAVDPRRGDVSFVACGNRKLGSLNTPFQVSSVNFVPDWGADVDPFGNAVWVFKGGGGGIGGGGGGGICVLWGGAKFPMGGIFAVLLRSVAAR